MDHPHPSKDEGARLRALERYCLLDTPREQDFDEIAEAAAELCETPIAVVNLIGDGRQFFKAEIGLGVRETPLETSFCRQALLQQDFLYVPDASEDPRFEGNPLVTGEPGLRFYAGALLKTNEGHPIGTVCVLDTKPHQLSEPQRKGLLRLARQTMAQMELRRSLREQAEQRLLNERILDSAIDYAIVAMDPAGRVTRWNAGAERILGWSEAEMLGRTVEVFFTPEDRAEGRPALEMRMSLEGQRAPDERWHTRKDGSRFWSSGEMMPLKSEDGALVGFLKILRDCTEHRAAEAALEASELRYRSLVEISPQVVWFADADGNVTYCNAYWYDYTGLPKGETGERSWMSVIHPDHREATRAAWLAASAAVRPYEVEFLLRRADGQYRWFLSRARPVPDGDGAPKSWIGTTLDIHDRRKAEEDLVKAREQLSLAAEATGTGIFDYDLITGVLTWDTRTRALFGLPPDSPVNYDVFLAGLHPDDRSWVDGAVQAALDPKGSGTYDIAFRVIGLTDGIERWIAAMGQAFVSGGRTVRFIGTTRDVTERKRAEEHERMLAGELQHRVKNTLTMVQAIANQTFRNAPDLDAARAAFSARLILLGRAHDILTRSSWTEAPIGEVVDGALAVHRGGPATRIDVSGPNVLLGAKPALALALALHELATNAAKYGALSCAEGRVDLRWRVTDEGDGPRFRLTWAEMDGPPIPAPPKRRGFGSRLIERSFAAEVGGDVELTFAPGGLTCRLEAPLASLQEPSAGA